MTNCKKIMISIFAAVFGSQVISAGAMAGTVTWDDGGADTIWSTVENWDNDLAPSAGNDYIVDGFTVQNPDNGGSSTSSTETFGGKSLAVNNGTIILYRNIESFSGREQHNIIPDFSLTDSTLDTRCGYASGKLLIDSPVKFFGDNTILVDTVRCSWTYQLVFTEAISGYGNIEMYRTSQGSGRTVYLNGDNSGYAGNWNVYSTAAETLNVHFYGTAGWGTGTMNLGYYSMIHFRVNVDAGSGMLVMDSTAMLNIYDKDSVIGGLEFDGIAVDPGTYTSAELNTLTGSSAFSGDGTLTINSLAWNPVPENGEEGVSIDSDLTWNTALDLDVTEHQLYLSAANDPNMMDVTPIIISDDNSGTGSYSPELKRSAVYTWRVDEKLSDGTILRGLNWTFETIPAVPVIDVQPADQFVFAGEQAVLAVEATDPFEPDTEGLSYQWYLGDSPVAGATDAEYIIAGTQVENEGTYKCIVTCDTNDKTTESETAIIVVKRQVVNLTFNETLEDNIGSNSGAWVASNDPNATLEFVDGFDPEVTGEALSLTGAGHVEFPASVFDNVTEQQISIAFWANVGSFEKTTVFGAYNESGSRMISMNFPWSDAIYLDAGNSFGYDRISKDKSPSELQDVWTYVVATKNIATGQMKIYLNGAEFTSGTGKTTPMKDAVSLYIGKGYSGEYWQGAIDDFQIYNYALDMDEVAGMYFDYTGVKTCLYRPAWDLSGPDGTQDCQVDLYDLEVIVESWLESGLIPR